MENIWLIVIIVYAVIVNIVGFSIMLSDKRKAISEQWRIPEKTFFIVSMLGGGIGTLIGMYMFRHKTKHKSFVFGLPLCTLIGLALIGVAVYFLIII